MADNAYCSLCDRTLKSPQGLHQHRSQKHPGLYCVDCRIMYLTWSNWNAHRNSRLHKKATVKCPASSCSDIFLTYGDLVLHWEAGTCPSGITRARLDDVMASEDYDHDFTNPNRSFGSQAPVDDALLERSSLRASWNGSAYECPLCPRTLRTTSALRAHLLSPAHDEKIYRCPPSLGGCEAEFTTLSGLMQHSEGERCGVDSNALHNALDGLAWALF